MLTFHCDRPIATGTLVDVAVRGHAREAVVVASVTKPDFQTRPITAPSVRAYSQTQIDIARFISEYYFSSLGEALWLFAPYGPNIAHERRASRIDAARLPTLTPEQQRACDALRTHKRALLFGVTGSGKTELFITLIAEQLALGRGAIFLMPEISLTPQMEKRLRACFGDQVAMWHSKLTRKKKEQILEALHSGVVRIVAGARSALFVPLRDLGLIIVDEEHDDSYKAMTRPRYHARDVALLMGERLGAQVLLASATPSAASYHKHPVVRLEQPYIQTHKHYRFVGGEGITPEMIEAIAHNHASGRQGLLFMPTRGNFKYLYCEACGETHRCPYCSVGMALHRSHRHLRCHYCSYTEAIREHCAACGHHPLRSERIGTAEAKEQIEAALPDLVIERFDRDTITTAKQLREALGRFERGESGLLLGTQMLSKGHDYRDITLAIVVGIDHLLGLADYRAGLRAMSLIVQIAGRSGRAHEAEVLIQTHHADRFAPYVQDYEAFLRQELGFLESAGYPPFASLARVLIAHKDPARAEAILERTLGQLHACKEVEIVGAGKAPIERIAGRYRYAILLRCVRKVPLLRALHHINCKEIEIDIDPVDFS
jgi:primosomal protein N' (replication factor Y) (superfamily II helicase)